MAHLEPGLRLGDEFGGMDQSPANDGYPPGARRWEETTMHPDIAYEIVSERRKAMHAQAAAIAQVRAARRAIRGSHGRSVPGPLSWVRVPMRPRAA